MRRGPGHEATFKSVTERFSYQKNHSPVKDWKFYDSTCSVVPTVAHAAGKRSAIKNGTVGDNSLIKKTNLGAPGSGGGGGGGGFGGGGAVLHVELV